MGISNHGALLLAGVLAIALACCALAADPRGIPVAPLPPFLCRPYRIPLDDRPPDNVNKLRPHDIQVVMAMGDSMTAAFGATAGKILSEPLVPREDRYLSFSGGGGAMQYTIANFIRLFNPNVVGGAFGRVTPLDDKEIDGHHPYPLLKKNIGLNAALSGAVAQDLEDEVNFLYDQLTTVYNETVDFENDWKLATILIGANNMCGACKNSSESQPDAFEQALDSAIQLLYEKIPRVRVNLLPMFNISQVYFWARTDKYCTRMWDTIASSECGCITPKSTTREDLEAVNVAAEEYRQRVAKIANKWASKNLSTFTVALQPFSANVKMINGDLTSNFDCFHPSWITHAYSAAALWNSMMLPMDQKPTNFTKLAFEGLDFICPTERTVLQ